MKTQSNIQLTGKVKALPMQPFLVGQTLADIKTNTRRLVKGKEVVDESLPTIKGIDYTAALKHPRFLPGDLAYITESHRVLDIRDLNKDVFISYGERTAKWNSVSEETYEKVKSKHYESFKIRMTPARFMFRDFTRCVALVEDVRPERLQDISEEDAIAEGIEESPFYSGGFWKNYDKKINIGGFSSAVNSFATLWDSIHTTPGERWEDNPWVWRIQYRKVWEGSSWHLHQQEVIASLKSELAV